MHLHHFTTFTYTLICNLQYYQVHSCFKSLSHAHMQTCYTIMQDVGVVTGLNPNVNFIKEIAKKVRTTLNRTEIERMMLKSLHNVP